MDIFRFLENLNCYKHNEVIQKEIKSDRKLEKMDGGKMYLEKSTTKHFLNLKMIKSGKRARSLRKTGGKVSVRYALTELR